MIIVARRLPSLNQLRAFEAAARHESIKMGADELCVTPAAVGHQIKALEQALNTPLFQRQTRKVKLTREGRALADKVERALDLLDQAVAQARKTDLTGTLKITIAPFFGNRWLLPRLPEFHKTHPGLTIQPSMSFDYVDLQKSGFDAAVRYGAGNWPGLSSVLICSDRIRPVCAPQLVDGCQLPLTAGQVLDLPLAFASHWREDWTAWAQAAGVSLTDTSHMAEHDSRAFMFDAALSGNAVILADSRMTAADEAAGRLVQLNPLTIDRPHGIYVVSPEKPPADPRLDLFTTWLAQEARS